MRSGVAGGHTHRFGWLVIDRYNIMSYAMARLKSDMFSDCPATNDGLWGNVMNPT